MQYEVLHGPSPLSCILQNLLSYIDFDLTMRQDLWQSNNF